MEAMARCGRPEIVNTGQGSQFTSAAFTGKFLEHGVAISMDGRGSWRGTVCASDWLRGRGSRAAAEAQAALPASQARWSFSAVETSANAASN